eukprot:gene2220-2737_t
MTTEKKATIDYYGAFTTNGVKIFLILDELGIDYKYHPINISTGEQFTPEFLKMNPNNKIPVIVDNSVTPPLVIFESGAILQYLGQKYGKFLPNATTHPRENVEVLQWLAWQVSGLGPILGQFSHFNYFIQEKHPYAIERFTKETERLFKVLDSHLETRKYVAGGDYSIADIAIYGWVSYLLLGWFGKDYQEKFPNVLRYVKHLNERPAVKKIYKDIETNTLPIMEKLGIIKPNTAAL